MAGYSNLESDGNGTYFQFNLSSSKGSLSILSNRVLDAGDELTAMGRVQSTKAVTGMTMTVKHGATTVAEQIITAKLAGKGKWGQVTLWTTMPENTIHGGSVTVEFTISLGDGSAVHIEWDGSCTYYGYRVNPAIVSCKFTRVNASGTAQADGIYLRCDDLTVSVSSGRSSADLDSLSWSVSPGSISGSFTVPAGLTHSDSGSPSSSWLLGDNTFSSTSEYTISFRLTAGPESADYTVHIATGLAKLHISGNADGGVAVGQFSTASPGNPLFEVAESHKARFYGGIDGVTNYEEGIAETGGTWIDGRKIWRFVTTGLMMGEKEVSIPFADSDAVDTVIDIRGAMDLGNVGWVSISGSNRGGNGICVYVDNHQGQGLVISVPDANADTSNEYIAIVYYTKK